MAINSRRKGKEGELEVAALLREYGYEESRRGQQYCGANGDADVVGLPGIHLEVKRVENLNIYEAVKKADEDCGGKMPVVVHRRNRKPWLVTMHFEDFMRLYESGRYKSGD